MAGKIVVVAPTYNEEENIAAFIKAVSQFKVKILIADSHSSDKTPKLVKKFKDVFYLDVKKRGLGLGLYEGINYAFNKLKAVGVVTMEADLSCNPEQVPEFIKLLQSCDFVVGSRYASGGTIVNWSWWRRFLSFLANLGLRFLSGALFLHEFTNLYRAFNRKTWDRIKKDLKNEPGWLFVPAFVFEAVNKNVKIKELPIRYHDRFGGRSKMNTVSYTKNLLVYAVSARIKKSASFFKFLVVGGIGFVINTAVLIIGVRSGMVPANAGLLGAELAIISNFFWNNLWTFSDRKLTDWGEIPKKFVTFNVLSFGSAIIQYAFLKAGELIFGLVRYKGPIIEMPIIKVLSWYMLFYVAGVAVGLIWNYIMYSRVIWRKKK